jgi:putative tricarboxylic transport membrane protein
VTALRAHDDAPAQPTEAAPAAGWFAGRSGLVVPLILAAFSTYLLVGVLTMEVPEGTDWPGPDFFPLLVAIAGYIVSALLVVKYIRQPEPAVPNVYSELDDVSAAERAEAEAAAKVRYRFFSDWRCLAWAIGGFAAFALILMPAGWIVAAALLFWCVARAMDSRRPLWDVVVALTVSSVAYLAFDVLLGMNLPSGILGGL